MFSWNVLNSKLLPVNTKIKEDFPPKCVRRFSSSRYRNVKMSKLPLQCSDFRSVLPFRTIRSKLKWKTYFDLRTRDDTYTLLATI